MNILSGVGILIALCVMAILIFKGVSPMLAGPVAVILVCITSYLSVLDALTNIYLHGVADFFVSFFPVFLLGNILGIVYEISGAATKIGQVIAKIFGAKKTVNCMIACMICAAVMSYGGINSFVIIFAVYPIALHLFREADIPTHLLPGIVCGGMWTFAMTGPFTPQIPNILSIENLGTSSYAGLVPGITASVVMAVLIVIYMTREANQCKNAGMHFENYQREEISKQDERKLPSTVSAFLPLIVIIVGFNMTDLGIVIWLSVGIVAAIGCNYSYLDKKELMKRVNRSAADSILVNMNTAAIVGFGSVTGFTAFYRSLIVWLQASQTNPYLTAVFGSNLCACILGSSSGGMALMYTSLKDSFLSFAAQGYNLGFIHRLCAFGSGCLDTMPWNGSILSVYSICHTTHKKSYKYNFVTCGIIPLICTIGIALPLCILLT